jgi:hypothetical protein
MADTTVETLRRQLITASEMWQKRSDTTLSNTGHDDPGATMAAIYAYTLAATLRIINDQYSEEVAQCLATDITGILTDGDFDDVNGDILVAEGGVR